MKYRTIVLALLCTLFICLEIGSQNIEGGLDYRSLGLLIDHDKAAATIKVSSKGAVKGQSITKTSRVNKEVLQRVIAKHPRKLCFEMVYFDEEATALFDQLSDLEEITLINTNVGDNAIRHLSKIKSLKGITVINGNITDESIFTFAQMTELEYLKLDRNLFIPWTADRLLQKLLPDTKVEVSI